GPVFCGSDRVGSTARQRTTMEATRTYPQRRDGDGSPRGSADSLSPGDRSAVGARSTRRSLMNTSSESESGPYASRRPAWQPARVIVDADVAGDDATQSILGR